MDSPFNIIIVGMTTCVKTYYILKVLETDYKGHFDYIIIIIICSTFEYNKTYQEWTYTKDSDVISIQGDQHHVDDMIRLVSEVYKGTNSLTILDDRASSQVAKNRTSELGKLGFSARHFGLSTIVIIQQLTSIAKLYGENVSKLINIYNTNRIDMDAIDYLYGRTRMRLKKFTTSYVTINTQDLRLILDILMTISWLNRKYNRIYFII